MDYDAEERAFDALVAEQRERQQAMRKMRCPRVLRYAVGDGGPLDVFDHARPFTMRTVEARCEREYGHEGDCIGRQANGQTFAAQGGRP